MKQLRKVRVIVATPKDTWAECCILEDIITELNLSLVSKHRLSIEIVRWDLSSPIYEITKFKDSYLRIHECDFLVGIFWKSFPTHSYYGNHYIDGLALNIFFDAYEEYKAKGRPRICLLFNQEPYTVNSAREQLKIDGVSRLRDAFSNNAIELKVNNIDDNKGLEERYCWTYKGRQEFSEWANEYFAQFIRMQIVLPEQQSLPYLATDSVKESVAHKNAYVVHTSIINLADYPFHIKKGLRPIWHSIFNNKKCFASSPSLLWDKNCFDDHLVRLRALSRGWGTGRRIEMYPPNSKPFIRGLGSIWFNTRNVRFERTPYNYRRERLLYNLRGEKHPYESLHEKDEWSSHFDDHQPIYFNYDMNRSYFGYDSEISDQRMNYLRYELRRPLILRTRVNKGEAQAKGKLFIHIYPSGYLVLHFAVALDWKDGVELTDIRQAILETSPSNQKSKLHWYSRLGEGNSSHLLRKVIQALQESFFKDQSQKLRFSPWLTSVRITSSAQNEEIASTLFVGEDDYSYLKPREEYQPARTHVHHMLVSKRNLVCVFDKESGRRGSLSVFWNILDLFEFIQLKQQIYKDYAKHLRDQVAELGVFRRSLKRKATEEDILRFSVYDENIPIFLSILDRQVHALSPFYRHIYSLISVGTKFDEIREKVRKHVTDWHAEVDKWEHPLSALWGKVLSPLRSVLSSAKGKF